MAWPGVVTVGTRAVRFGRSSITFEQAIFQNNACAAVSSNVIVRIDRLTRKSAPLPEDVVARFNDLV